MTNMLKPLRRFLCKRTLSPKALGLATLGRQRHACDLSCALPMEDISPYACDDGGGTNAALFQAYFFSSQRYELSNDRHILSSESPSQLPPGTSAGQASLQRGFYPTFNYG
jgi:hypothetical protein